MRHAAWLETDARPKGGLLHRPGPAAGGMSMLRIPRKEARVSRSSLGLWLVPALVASMLAGAAPGHAQDAVDDFRARLEKWVDTRNLISEEESEWEAEQETLRATRDLLEEQKRELEETLAEVEQSNTQADEERRELLLRRGELQRANRAAEARLFALEREILELAPRLPVPLQERLEPLLAQIPASAETERSPSLGQRLVSVLGVLAQADKWNATANLVGETRALGGDQKLQVRTLYWGLGQAVYVAARNRTAGVARPGAESWEFLEKPDLIDEAALILDIYEGNIDAIEFVEMPVQIR